MVGSIVATTLASSEVEKYFGTIRLVDEPVGYLPEDLRRATEMAIARFQLVVLMISGPLVVGLNSTGGSGVAVPLVVASALSMISWLIYAKLDKLNSPRKFVAWNERGHIKNINLTVVDTWTGLVVLLNVFVVAVN